MIQCISINLRDNINIYQIKILCQFLEKTHMKNVIFNAEENDGKNNRTH